MANSAGEFTCAPMLSLQEAMRQAEVVLLKADIEAARREVRLLVQAATGFSSAEVLLRAKTPIGEAASVFVEMVRQRAARVPFARITGLREFYGLSFGLTPATLVPRPDTEILVEAVLDHVERRDMADQPLRIVDLGTGSGAILTALLHQLPAATGIGVDISAEAAETAQRNFARHCNPARARFLVCHWLDGLDGVYDVIVSNPPYIPTADLATLEAEVRDHDPLLALDGGNTGLDAYRVLAAAMPSRLVSGGLVALELGIGQEGDVRRLMEDAGLRVIECRADLAGIARVLVCEKS